MFLAPYFGYLASLCLIIALLVSTDLKFRIFNIIGCVSFIIYAIFFEAWPVLITNLILLSINVFYLGKTLSYKEKFDLLELHGEDALAKKFLSFHKEDIAGYFPEFSPVQMTGNLTFAVIRDLVIANIFSAKVSADGRADVVLNYTAKKYRDYKVGRFLFEKERQFLISRGVTCIFYRKVFNKSHEAFLKKIGFAKDGEHYLKLL